MKNYLFAPFKDDDEKIEEFNNVVHALKFVVDAEETHCHESALHGLRIFIGRLESYYDAIIKELKEELSNWLVEDKLFTENKELKARIEICKENHVRYDIKAIDENTELKAELDKVKRCNKTMDGILLEREEEIKELKADNERLKKGFGHGVLVELEELEELKAENKELKHELKHKAIKIHQDRIPREYKAEAEEYFHHNPHCKELLFFMIEDGHFNDDEEYNHYLYKDDAICTINNDGYDERSN